MDAETDRAVDPGDIVKGYEARKNEYIELEPDELDAIALDSTRVIEINKCVPANEIDELYLNQAYYIAPNGEVGAQAFAVIREAMRKDGMVALGKVVFTSREHVIALKPRGAGLLGVTLHYPYEVRAEKASFDDIPDEKVPKDMLDLACHILETKRGRFDPKTFEDHYEDALKDLLRKKKKGETIEPPKEAAPSNVVDLMEALRRSVGASGRRKQPSHREAAPRPGRRSSAARHRKAS